MTKETLTYSALKAFKNCRRKYQHRYIEQLVPVERDATLHLGTMFHNSLESWYRLDLEGLPKDQAAIDSILIDIDNSYPNRTIDAAEKRSWHLARTMFQAYISRYAHEPWQVVAVEREFSSAIVNPQTGAQSRSFEMRGKVDLVVQMHETGEYFIVEHKTAANITGDYIDRLPLDSQIQIYCKYISQELGIPISGVIYNVVAKAQLRQRQGETEEEFQERRAQLIAKSKTGKSSAKRKMPETDEAFQARLAEKYESPGMFLRQELYVSPQDAEEVQAEVWDLSKQLLFARRCGSWYRNTDFCFRYNKPCAYFELCRSGEESLVIDSLYTRRRAHSELADSNIHTPAF